MIRALTVVDLPALTDCAGEFYGASPSIREFHMDRFCEIWTALLGCENGAIFADEREGKFVGMIGGIVHREMYSDRLIAAEAFWFVQEAFRGRGVLLYRKLEKWARVKGAVELHMMHLLDLMPERVAAFYRRVGFAPVETRYLKALT